MAKKDTLVWVLVLGAVGAVIGLVVYVKWVAYFQRFPDSSWWTFFIQ